MSSGSARSAVLLTLLICGHAHAQVPEAPPAAEPPAPAAEPPAPAVEPSPVAAPAVPESPEAIEARAAVVRAKALVAVENYGAALAEYTRALELLEGDPRQAAVLNNIAVCYERMFRYDLALQYYESYLREADASTEDRAEVEQIVASLRALLGTVRITGVHTGEIWIDDRKLGDAPIDILVPAGFHVLEIRARGYEPARRELRVAAGAVHDVHIELVPIDTYRGLPPTYFWVGTGLTTAAAITGTVLGVSALNEHERGEADAMHGRPVDGQPARSLALQADIAFGATLALGIGTTVLFFLTDWSSPSEERAGDAIQLGFGVTTRAFGLSLTGSTP
jgi:tetratricopeptide (TPR) repeat protein